MLPLPSYRQRRHKTWLYGLVAVAATATLLASGCARPGPAPAGGRDPGVGPVPPAGAGQPGVLLRTADLRLPLDTYLLSIAESARLARASRILLRQCVAGFGLDYATPDPAAVGPRTWNERRYGLTDPDQAARGYWPRDRTVPPRPRHAAVTAAVTAVVTGTGSPTVHGRPVPSGGCTAQAYRQLTANDPPGADRYLAQRLSSDSFFASRQDQPVRAATSAWSACLRAAGHPYPTPLDPPQDSRFQGPVATPLEIATATADVTCKRRTNLVGAWYADETGRQRALIAANLPALQRARAAFDAELAVAANTGV